MNNDNNHSPTKASVHKNTTATTATTIPSPSNFRSIPVSLGKPSLRLRLEAYYSLIAPEVLSNPVEWRSKFDQIYDKYGGSHQGECKLARNLEKKYGSTVRLLIAADEEDPETRTTAASNSSCHTIITGLQDSNNNHHDESWYELRPTERGSGVLSFVSDSFDPIAALAAAATNNVSDADALEAANPWIATCPILDNIDQFRVYLPVCDPLHRAMTKSHKAHQNATTSDSQQQQQQQLLHDNKRPKIISAFSSIAAAACHDQNKGPMMFLHRMMANRCRVRVLIRYVDCIRGTLTGYLLAFDKHFNMILRDVDEVYTPRDGATKEDGASSVERELHRRQNAVQGEGGGVVLAAPTSVASSDVHHHHQTGTWTVRQRHLPQLLVRGDNVVTVYQAESERSAWPRTLKSPESSLYRKKNFGDAITIEQRVGTPGSLIYALQQRERQRSQKAKTSRHVTR